MANEIERKYLIREESWKKECKASGVPIRQGYLSTLKERTVRVRILGDRAFLTVKGITVGATRNEFEYAIPVKDAAEMLDHLCEKPLLEKLRHVVIHQNVAFEVDVFGGENAGLVIAEVELESENQAVDLPEWIGKEVTSDPRYFNSNLTRNPFGSW